MDGQILRIGKIPYANLFPIFYVLERDMDCSQYEFVEGMPSTLNRMLRDGDIDLSPNAKIGQRHVLGEDRKHYHSAEAGQETDQSNQPDPLSKKTVLAHRE